MKNDYQSLFYFLIFVVIYEIFLILLSPIIDHAFTSLDQDRKLKETNTQILGEIILHVVVLTVAFLFLEYVIKVSINKINPKNFQAYKTAAELLTAITLIGLQRNLINKLIYITNEHPFRLIQIEEKK